MSEADKKSRRALATGSGEVAPPRQVNVMHGPTYQPGAWAPARAGAAAYRQIPSLMGSRRVPFRSAE